MSAEAIASSGSVLRLPSAPTTTHSIPAVPRPREQLGAISGEIVPEQHGPARLLVDLDERTKAIGVDRLAEADDLVAAVERFDPALHAVIDDDHRLDDLGQLRWELEVVDLGTGAEHLRVEGHRSASA